MPSPTGDKNALPALIPLKQHTGTPAIPLGRPVMLIGSRKSAHIHLISSKVSRAHALLIVADGKVFLRDLSSRTHTYINGQQTREAALEDGDLMQIGSFVFRLRIPTEWALQGQPREVAGGQLRVGGDHVGIHERVVLIGRRPSNDLALMEESASTAHAVLLDMGGKRFIRDLGSRTGTFVNGKKIHQEPLSFGDVIRIGETDFVYEEASATAVAPMPVDDEIDELEDLVGTAPLGDLPGESAPAEEEAFVPDEDIAQGIRDEADALTTHTSEADADVIPLDDEPLVNAARPSPTPKPVSRAVEPPISVDSILSPETYDPDAPLEEPEESSAAAIEPLPLEVEEPATASADADEPLPVDDLPDLADAEPAAAPVDVFEDIAPLPLEDDAPAAKATSPFDAIESDVDDEPIAIAGDASAADAIDELAAVDQDEDETSEEIVVDAVDPTPESAQSLSAEVERDASEEDDSPIIAGRISIEPSDPLTDTALGRDLSGWTGQEGEPIVEDADDQPAGSAAVAPVDYTKSTDEPSDQFEPEVIAIDDDVPEQAVDTDAVADDAQSTTTDDAEDLAPIAIAPTSDDAPADDDAPIAIAPDDTTPEQADETPIAIKAEAPAPDAADADDAWIEDADRVSAERRALLEPIAVEDDDLPIDALVFDDEDVDVPSATGVAEADADNQPSESAPAAEATEPQAEIETSVDDAIEVIATDGDDSEADIAASAFAEPVEAEAIQAESIDAVEAAIEAIETETPVEEADEIAVSSDAIAVTADDVTAEAPVDDAPVPADFDVPDDFFDGIATEAKATQSTPAEPSAIDDALDLEFDAEPPSWSADADGTFEPEVELSPGDSGGFEPELDLIDDAKAVVAEESVFPPHSSAHDEPQAPAPIATGYSPIDDELPPAGTEGEQPTPELSLPDDIDALIGIGEAAFGPADDVAAAVEAAAAPTTADDEIPPPPDGDVTGKDAFGGVNQWGFLGGVPLPLPEAPPPQPKSVRPIFADETITDSDLQEEARAQSEDPDVLMRSVAGKGKKKRDTPKRVPPMPQPPRSVVPQEPILETPPAKPVTLPPEQAEVPASTPEARQPEPVEPIVPPADVPEVAEVPPAQQPAEPPATDLPVVRPPSAIRTTAHPTDADVEHPAPVAHDEEFEALVFEDPAETPQARGPAVAPPSEPEADAIIAPPPAPKEPQPREAETPLTKALRDITPPPKASRRNRRGAFELDAEAAQEEASEAFGEQSESADPVDAFSQLRTPRGEDPVFGKIQVDSSDGDTLHDVEFEAGDDHDHGLELEPPEPAGSSPAQRDGIRPPAVQFPQEAPRRKKRKWFFSIPFLLLMMLLCLGAAAASIWTWVPETGIVAGRLRFDNLSNRAVDRQQQFADLQAALLLDTAAQDGSTRTTAISHLPRGVNQGFLASTDSYTDTMSAAIATLWAPENPNEMTIRLQSADPDGDQQRLLAIMESLYERNTRLLEQYRNHSASLDIVVMQYQEVTRTLEDKRARLHEMEQTAARVPNEAGLTALRSELTELDQRARQLAAEASVAQARLEQLIADDTAHVEVASATETSPVADDSTLREMTQQIETLRSEIVRRRDAEAAEAMAARQTLDQSILLVQQQIADVQSQMKDVPGINEYLAVAKLIQSELPQWTDELIHSQKELHDTIIGMKRKLDESMIARRNHAWSADTELQQMIDLRKYQTRQINAAQSAEGRADAKAIAELEKNAAELDARIEQRKTQIGTDPFYDEAARDLATIIAVSERRLEENRKSMALRLNAMQTRLAEAAPALEQLPAEQKALAAALEKRLDELNNARLAWSEALTGASANEASDAELSLTEQIAAVELRMNTRKAALMSEQQRTLSEQQRNALLQERQQLAEHLTTLRAEETRVTEARNAKFTQVVQAERTIDEAHAQVSQREVFQADIVRLAARQDDLQKEQTSLKAAVAAAIHPQQPGMNDVMKTDRVNDRPRYMLLGGGAIVLLFVTLMLLSSLAPYEQPTATPPAPEGRWLGRPEEPISLTPRRSATELGHRVTV